jgi:hypothetical protein
MWTKMTSGDADGFGIDGAATLEKFATGKLKM